MSDNPPKTEDFEAIEAAVLETARGRWFLAEYARRQRQAETAGLADALLALEGRLVAHRHSEDMARMQIELLDLARTIHQTRNDVMTAFGVTKSKASAAPGESRAAAAQRAASSLRHLENRVQILLGQAGADPLGPAAQAAEEPIEAIGPAEAAVKAEAAPDPVAAVEQISSDTTHTSTADSDDAEVAPDVMKLSDEGKPIDREQKEAAAEASAEEAEPAEAQEVKPAERRLDNHEHLATTLRAAIAQVRGPSSDVDALSFEAKSVLFA